MVRKASQFPLKFDPQSNDYVVGLDAGNPNQFIRIPLAALAPGEGIDLENIPVADAVTAYDFVLGHLENIPDLLRIPINLLPNNGGSLDLSALPVLDVLLDYDEILIITQVDGFLAKIQSSLASQAFRRKSQITQDISSESDYELSLSSEYFQFLNPTSELIPSVILPALGVGDYFEVEIINTAIIGNRQIQIKDNNLDDVYLIEENLSGLFNGIYLFWENSFDSQILRKRKIEYLA